MRYSIATDIKVVCTLLNLSFSELANELGVARSTVNRIVKEETYPNNNFLEIFYSYAYRNHIRSIDLNALKIQFAKDKCDKLLFHGSRQGIDPFIDLNHSRDDIDMGRGFYLGESYEQASFYVFSMNKSSIYVFDSSKLSSLKIKEYSVSLEWMLIVAYFRGQLEAYKNSSIIKKLIQDLNEYDVIVAPIADNNMYDIMNRFARGDITDKQAISALSASNLGKQHVLRTKKACSKVSAVDHLYISIPEREAIEKKAKENALLLSDKSKISIERFRRQGLYIEEILK